MNAAGDEIVVLFPDTIVTDTLHVYNITKDTWKQESVLSFYPVDGRWAEDIVYLLNKPMLNLVLRKMPAFLPAGLLSLVVDEPETCGSIIRIAIAVNI